MTWRISFSKFSDLLSAFTWANAISNLISICKVKYFLAISTTLSDFHFQEFPFLNQ